MALRERLIAVDEQRNRAWKQASDLIELAASEERGLTDEEQQQYDGWVAEVDELGKQRSQIEAHEARSAKLATPQREVRYLPGGDQVVTQERGREVDQEEYRAAFRRYIRAQDKADISAEDRLILARGRVHYDEEGRALTTQTGSSGGYTIPQGFEDMLTKARKAYGGMRQARTRQFTTETGNTIPIPSLDDTGNKGVLLAENTQMATQDVAFATRNLKAYVMHSKAVLVPWQLMQDSAFDVENDILAPAFGERIGRIENDYFTTGTGTDQPLGIVSAATSSVTGSGASAAVGPTYGDLVSLFHSVDPAYRAQAEWMMNDTTVSVVRQLVDGNSRPLWLPANTGGLANDVPDTILGRAVIVNQSMADPGTVSDYPIAFGDFSYYWIRTVRGIQVIRLDERYADYLQTGFFAYSRVDGTLVNPGNGPIKLLRSKAS